MVATVELRPSSSADISMDTTDVRHDNVNYNDYKLWPRLRADRSFRRRSLYTIYLFWSFIGLGWVASLNGPTFPDLRGIARQDLASASWLFTIFSLGYLVGSLVAGFLYERFNKQLLLCCSIWLNTLSVAVIPWSYRFELMLVVKFLTGIGCGCLDAFGCAELLSTWEGQGKAYMQALQFCYSFGGIISPLVVEPFLARKICLLSNENNMTSAADLTMTTEQYGTNHTTIDGVCVEAYGETKVYYAFSISAATIFTTSWPLLVLYFRSFCRKDIHVSESKEGDKRPDKLPRKLKVLFLVLLVCLTATYCAVEDTYVSFLMTFCLNHLSWTKEQGSFANSTFWAAFSIGRFSGGFLVRFFTQGQLIFSFYFMLVLSFCGLLISSLTYSEPAIWTCIVFTGLAMSVIFGFIFTWTEEQILPVTGTVTAILLASGSAGLLLNPMMLGYLMENYTGLSFVYVLLAESVLGLGLLLTIKLVQKCYVKPTIQSSTVNIVSDVGGTSTVERF